MSVLASVTSGLQSALLLARGRADGIALVQTDRDTAIRSFWAIPLCLPAVVCMKLIDWVEGGMPANPPLALGRHLMMFGVGWLMFVVLSHHMAGRIGRLADWPRFIAIWSYCSVIENTLIAIGGMPGAVGAPAIVDQACQLITIGWAFWLEWYSIGLSLRVGALTATIFLAVDIAIGVVIAMAGGG